MRRLVGVLAAALVLCACGKGITYDKEADDLGARIVADLKARPEVSDASYRYDHGVDAGQNLRFRAILKREAVSEQAVAETIDLAVKEWWLSPANVPHMVITVYSNADPPTAEDDAANRGRAIGSKDVSDSPTIDGPALEQKYGPRATHPPKSR